MSGEVKSTKHDGVTGKMGELNKEFTKKSEFNKSLNEKCKQFINDGKSKDHKYKISRQLPENYKTLCDKHGDFRRVKIDKEFNKTFNGSKPKDYEYPKNRYIEELSPVRRGQEIEHGRAKDYKKYQNIRRLPKNFKTLDFIKDGNTGVRWGINKERNEVIDNTVGISLKTFDARCKSFKTADSTYNYFNKYARQLKNYNSYRLKGVEVRNLKKRILNLEYLGGKLSTEQKEGLLKLNKKYKKKDFEINVSKFR